MKPKGTRMDPKGRKWSQKGVKREPKSKQSASKSRLGRQGRFWEPKGVTAREFLGDILLIFRKKSQSKIDATLDVEKKRIFIKKRFKKSAKIDATTE